MIHAALSDNSILYNDPFEEVMATQVRDNSVDLIVTSPPYWVEKEYERKIPFADYELMLRTLYTLASEKLKPAGYMVINFGEIHNSKGRMYKANCPSTYPAACLHFPLGREVGFDLQTSRIWRKQFARCNRGFSVNIRPMCVYDFEMIWVWRKPGNEGKEFVNDSKLSQRAVLGEDWKSPARIDKHCAAFPIELPLWAIDVYVNPEVEKPVVLDPFMGSGTTIVAALQRNCFGIGIEKNEEYFNYAVERITKETGEVYAK